MNMQAEEKKKERAAERTDTRRRQIFEAAALVFAEKGYHSATMQDVAEAAGLGKGTLYEYFPSKQELLLSLVEEGQNFFFDEMVRVTEEKTGPQEKLRAMALAALRVAEMHSVIARVIMPVILGLEAEEKDRIEAGKERFMLLWEKLLDQGVAEGVFRPMNARVMGELMLHNCWLWSHCPTIGRHVGSIEDFEALMSDVFFNGILRRDISGDKE